MLQAHAHLTWSGQGWKMNSFFFPLFGPLFFCAYANISFLPFFDHPARNSMWCTDLGSLIGYRQCGNFRIFLLLRFYVKSFLVILRPKKLPFWLFEQLWILNFWRLLYIFKSEIFQKIKILSLQNDKNDSFWPSEISQIWFHIKSEWQENC